MIPNPQKLPFAYMEGLPALDDEELNSLTATASRLPRASVDKIVRHLCRAALGHERTGNADYLTCLSEDALVTLRLRSDPESDKAYEDAPDKPAPADETISVEELLRDRGL